MEQLAKPLPEGFTKETFLGNETSKLIPGGWADVMYRGAKWGKKGKYYVKSSWSKSYIMVSWEK